MKQEIESEDLCIQAWQSLIRRFNKCTPKDKKELENILADAKSNGNLTARQQDSLNERVKNMLAGTYGVTKSDLQLAGGKM
jgi:hypothetical protein